MGKAGASRCRFLLRGQPKGESSGSKGFRERSVEVAVALLSRGESHRASGGESQEKGEILAVFHETAAGKPPYRVVTVRALLVEITDRDRRMVPVIETGHGETGGTGPEEEGLIQGHVGGSRPVFRIAPER